MNNYSLTLKIGSKKIRVKIAAEDISEFTGQCELVSIEKIEDEPKKDPGLYQMLKDFGLMNDI